MRSTPAPVVHVSPVHAQKSTGDGLTRIQGVWGVTNHFYSFIFTDEKLTPHLSSTFHPAHAQKSTEDGTNHDPGGWLVSIHFYQSFL